MGFSQIIDIELVGFALALLVLFQLGLELRRIYLKNMAARGVIFLQVQGRLEVFNSEKESLGA